MRRIVMLTALLLPSCGGAPVEPPAAEPAPVGEIRLGMIPDEVAKAIGPADFSNVVSTGDGQIHILWTYKKRHHVVLRGENGERDFPRGCILTFGEGGRKLTEVEAPGIPLDRPIPRVPPAPPAEASPKEVTPPASPLAPGEAQARVEALLSSPEEGLQAAVDRVMLHFPDCLPGLIEALSRPDRKLPEDLRLFIPPPPGEPVDRLRRVRPAGRLALLLNLLNQGTSQHFGTPEKPEDIPAIAAKWKAWFSARP